MAISSTSSLFLILTVAFISLLLTSSDGQPSDVHDLLPSYNLPVGILPNAVKSYTLSDAGVFTVQLERTCYVQFGDQLVYYGKLIKGNLGKGSVTGVSGIQAKKLFVWVSVTGMKADLDSGTVEFYVGALSEELPARLFDSVPNCLKKGCADDDDKVRGGRVGIKSMAASAFGDS